MAEHSTTLCFMEEKSVLYIKIKSVKSVVEKICVCVGFKHVVVILPIVT